jgi:hypothetical protein
MYGTRVAWHSGGKFHMCEFDVQYFQPEFKTEKIWYCSMGSAQAITDPFLGFIRRVFWQDGLPSVQDAAFAVAWTLQHAIDLNTGGVNGPVRIAILQQGADSKLHARQISEQEISDHTALAKEAEAHLRTFGKAMDPGEDTAEVPRPPSV